jgi:hypothetical protein
LIIYVIIFRCFYFVILYYIDYQNILVEGNYYPQTETRGEKIKKLDDTDEETQEYFLRLLHKKRKLDFYNVYHGRINRLKFKLCHDYCETCYELSKSNDDQKCLSCLPEYQYDYLYFSNRSKENPNLCVPEVFIIIKIGKNYTYVIRPLIIISSTLQVIKKYVFQKKKNILVPILTQFIMKQQKNALIAILNVLKMVNAPLMI